MELKISIVTCSDTRDLAQDEAGAALEELIEAQGWTVASHVVVRDDASEIGDAIVEAADECHANVVLTCGGTGLSMRDVTPEATRAVCDRDVPGIAEAIRAYSMTKTRRAMLSRAVCMQRGHTLVINFPGSTKAARESWKAVSGPAGARGSDDGGRRAYQISASTCGGATLSGCSAFVYAADSAERPEVYGNSETKLSDENIFIADHYSRRKYNLIAD